MNSQTLLNQFRNIESHPKCVCLLWKLRPVWHLGMIDAKIERNKMCKQLCNWRKKTLCKSEVFWFFINSYFFSGSLLFSAHSSIDPIPVTPEPTLKRPTHLDLMPVSNFTPKKSPIVSESNSISLRHTSRVCVFRLYAFRQMLIAFHNIAFQESNDDKSPNPAPPPLQTGTEIQHLRDQLDQQALQTREALFQLMQVREQLISETNARIEAQVRTVWYWCDDSLTVNKIFAHQMMCLCFYVCVLRLQARTQQLLQQNRELLEHLASLGGYTYTENERAGLTSANISLAPQVPELQMHTHFSLFNLFSFFNIFSFQKACFFLLQNILFITAFFILCFKVLLIYQQKSFRFSILCAWINRSQIIRSAYIYFNNYNNLMFAWMWLWFCF